MKKSVLVFRSAALGDFIMSNPAFVELRKCFPEHRVILLTMHSADKSQREKVAKYAGDSKSMPWIELIMPHLVDEFVVLKSNNPIYLWQLRRYFSKYKFECAVVMSDVWGVRMGRWKKLFLMRFLLGFIPVLGWRGVSDPWRLMVEGRLKHHVHGPLQFLSEMQPPRVYRDENLRFDVRPGAGAIEWVENWLRENTLSNKRLVVIAPGSIQPHKFWPENSFCILIKELLSKYSDISIVLVGTPNHWELANRLLSLAPDRVHNLAGKSSVAQSAALMARSSLVVGNDGGAMHLADSMGAIVISIVPGIEFPDSIEPWHNKARAVRHEVDCSPCYNFLYCPQGHNKCLVDLPVEKVLSKCIDVLSVHE
jgi:heptosyltransferase-2